MRFNMFKKFVAWNIFVMITGAPCFREYFYIMAKFCLEIGEFAIKDGAVQTVYILVPNGQIKRCFEGEFV